MNGVVAVFGVFCEDWSVVSQLDGVEESEEPEFGGKEMFCHVVSG